MAQPQQAFPTWLPTPTPTTVRCRLVFGERFHCKLVCNLCLSIYLLGPIVQMFKRCYLMTDKAERLSMKDLLNVVVVVFVWWYVWWCLCGGMYGGVCVVVCMVVFVWWYVWWCLCGGMHGGVCVVVCMVVF